MSTGLTKTPGFELNTQGHLFLTYSALLLLVLLPLEHTNDMPVRDTLQCSCLMATGGSIPVIAELLGVNLHSVSADIYLESGQQLLLILSTLISCGSAACSL